jgi:xylulokinase
VMLSAGGSLQWYRNTLCTHEIRAAEASERDAYDVMIDAADDIEPGCEGLLFLPYLTGERTPHPDPYARGAFIGLTRRHTKAHMTRAVLEGVTFGLRDALELMRDLGLHIATVRASGGGARSALWRQMLADILHANVETVTVTQGAAFGAALLAGVGAGVYSDVGEACRRTVGVASTTMPGDDVARYDAPYQHYRALYPALKDTFRSIGESL